LGCDLLFYKKYFRLNRGKLRELEIKQILEKYFETTLNTSSKYVLIDFYNDDMYIELKSRRNTFSKFRNKDDSV
jgi:hypothetical protein